MFKGAGLKLAGQTKSLAVSAGGVGGRNQRLIEGQGQLMHDRFQDDVVPNADMQGCRTRRTELRGHGLPPEDEVDEFLQGTQWALLVVGGLVFLAELEQATFR
ncbi:hypothetical protein D3C75_365840 [compost metagenome]